MTAAPVPATISDGLAVEHESSRAWRYLRANPSFWIGAILVALIVGAAVLAPLLAPHDPNFQFRGEGLTLGGDPLGPTVKFPLGTDKLAVDSIVTADVPLILGTVLFGTLCIVLANLAVDVAQVLIDPRIRR